MPGHFTELEKVVFYLFFCSLNRGSETVFVTVTVKVFSFSNFDSALGVMNKIQNKPVHQ